MIVYILPVLAVFTGFLIAYLFKPVIGTSVRLLLSFSGAFLLGVMVFEFLPELFAHKDRQIGIGILLGILIQIILESLSRGAEHGHLHLDPKMKQFPLLLFLGLAGHAFFEGLPLGNNPSLLIGVVVHKVPIAIIVSAFLLVSDMSKMRIFTFLLLFGLMTPLGSWMLSAIPGLQAYSVFLLSVVVGLLLHVSTTIIFESSKNHQFNLGKISVIVAGMVLSYFV
ncbi:ZIP family metal transporter [Croceiramulus getboli]|nr:ZIP family metal transporter [Flavobacteriaceae bacterium YJPT1-3]